MKRKSKTVISIILVLAFALTMLVGCDEIFKMNKDRDAHQIVADIHYGNQSAKIEKFELEANFNSYGYFYNQYYGMSFQGAADYLLKSLAQRELLVMFAKKYLAEQKDGEGANPNLYNLYSTAPGAQNLLSLSEYDKAIRTTNDDMLSSLAGLVEKAINEENRTSTKPKDKVEPVKGNEKQKITIRFDSNDGSKVNDTRINNGATMTEPTEPTREGYKFYGWFTDADLTLANKIDFEKHTFTVENYGGKNEDGTKVKKYITIYAKWVETTAARPEIPKPDEEAEKAAKDKDYDADKETLPEGKTLAPLFFTDEYKATIDFTEKDFFEKIKVADGLTGEAANAARKVKLDKFVNDKLVELKKQLEEGYKSYDYFVQNELKSRLITRLERKIGADIKAGDTSIEKKFAELVKENQNLFEKSEENYSSALTKSLSTTYYQKLTILNDGQADASVSSYGFVNNILLKLDQESMDKLVEMTKNGTTPQVILHERDKMLKEIKVKVSNPTYDPKFVEDYGTDENGKKIGVIDPMTDPANKFNDYDADGKATGTVKDDKYHKNKAGDIEYDTNKLISFVQKKDADGNVIPGKWEVKFNAKESPAMPYLISKVPAFTNGVSSDDDYQKGIIDQIYDSFEEVNAQVVAGNITHVEGIYWLREVAKSWLFIVGDDPGSTKDDSNNKGLGYLVNPEGLESGFLTDFTNQARKLIANGTGSYTTAAADASRDDRISGMYVYADSLVQFNKEGEFSGYGAKDSYAGIFILLASHVVWDENAWTVVETKTDNGDGTFTTTYEERQLGKDAFDRTTGILPLGYIMTYGETLKDCVTVREQLVTSIEDGQKATKYNMIVNKFGLENTKNITYNAKAYKSLWKNLDK